MKKKNLIALIMVCILIAGLVACGKADNSQTSKPAAEGKAEEVKEEAEKEAQEASDSEAKASDEKAENSKEKAEEAVGKETEKPAKPVYVMICIPLNEASSMIWNNLIEPLKEEGLELNTLMYYDYSDLKNFMETGQVDLMVGYEGLEDTSVIAYTLCTPYNIYSDKYSTVEELADANATVAVPGNFRYNERAQEVLEAAGLVTLSNGTSPELEQEDYDSQVQFGGFSGDVTDELWTEYFDAVVSYGTSKDREPIFTDPAIKNGDKYWQKMYCRTEDTQDPEKLDAYEKVVKAYQSEAVSEMLKENGSVPVGWDQDLISQYR